MKNNFLVLMFLFVTVAAAYSQSTVTITHTNTTNNGVWCVTQSGWSTGYSPQFVYSSSTEIEIGNKDTYFPNSSNDRGRGFWAFDLNQQYDVLKDPTKFTSVKLVFNTGSASSSSIHSIKINRLSQIPLATGNYSTVWSAIGNGTLIGTVSNLTANSSNKEFTISKNIIADVLRPGYSGGLFLGLVYGGNNDSENGISIKNARIVITLPAVVTTPSAPTNLQHSNVSTKGVTLSWSASSGSPTKYRVYRSNGTMVQEVSGSTLTAAITNLSPNTPYSFYVRAYNTAGESGNSNAVSFNTLPVPVITGPSSICYNSPGSFSVSNAPNNFTWSKSSNISLSSTSNTSITASTTVNNSGQG